MTELAVAADVLANQNVRETAQAAPCDAMGAS